jgi:glycosyltransferase involved in cell wall biosynthesis
MKPLDDPLRIGWMAWEGESSSGYAHIADKFHYHLQDDKRFFFPNAYSQPWDALLCITTPTRWMIGPQLTPRPDIVFHTMFEANPIPPGWADVMNCAGLIWTPSQYAADLFRENGVAAPMFVAGYGVNHDEYVEIDRSDRAKRKDTMKFLLWADTLFSRKNVTQVAKAFIAAGLPDAELEVKLHSFAGMNPSTVFSDAKGRPLANITIHTGVWQRKKLVTWLHSGDCGLYGSGGEGFGLMPLEQMATGLPMICANNTGMMEYLKPGNHIPVACPKMVKDMTYSIGYGYPAMTYQPDFDEMVEKIRWAYNNRAALDEIGAAGAMESRKWDWKQQTDIAASHILRHFGRSV